MVSFKSLLLRPSGWAFFGNNVCLSFSFDLIIPFRHFVSFVNFCCKLDIPNVTVRCPWKSDSLTRTCWPWEPDSPKWTTGVCYCWLYICKLPFLCGHWISFPNSQQLTLQSSLNAKRWHLCPDSWDFCLFCFVLNRLQNSKNYDRCFHLNGCSDGESNAWHLLSIGFLLHHQVLTSDTR